MTPTPTRPSDPAVKPRTKAGRALLAELAYTRDNYLDLILAIEAEATEQAKNDRREPPRWVDGKPVPTRPDPVSPS